jgi:Ca-activated chloride channel family protein
MVHRAMDEVNSFQKTTHDFQFAAAVASFGMLLRDSRYQGNTSYSNVYEIAKSARGEDRFGYREEFLQLVDTARRLAQG